MSNLELFKERIRKLANYEAGDRSIIDNLPEKLRRKVEDSSYVRIYEIPSYVEKLVFDLKAKKIAVEPKKGENKGPKALLVSTGSDTYLYLLNTREVMRLGPICFKAELKTVYARGNAIAPEFIIAFKNVVDELLVRTYKRYMGIYVGDKLLSDLRFNARILLPVEEILEIVEEYKRTSRLNFIKRWWLRRKVGGDIKFAESSARAMIEASKREYIEVIFSGKKVKKISHRVWYDISLPEKLKKSLEHSVSSAKEVLDNLPEELRKEEIMLIYKVPETCRKLGASETSLKIKCVEEGKEGREIYVVVTNNGTYLVGEESPKKISKYPLVAEGMHLVYEKPLSEFSVRFKSAVEELLRKEIHRGNVNSRKVAPRDLMERRGYFEVVL